MSQLNPYDSFLDGRPVDAILSSTADAIADCLYAIGPNRTDTASAPGKWSAAEIVCHLADCELVFGFRLRQTLAEDGPTIQPFDQDKWAASYSGIPADEALAAFTALTELEFAHDSRRASRRSEPHHDPSRARNHDLSNRCRNHGRPRSESSRPVAPHRRPKLLGGAAFIAA